MLRLRKVCQADCELLFAWANDPCARQNSIHTTSILWDTHAAWFARKQADCNCLHLIAEDCDGQPVGQIRFDISIVRTEYSEAELWEAEISLSLDYNQRGKGYGVRLVAQGIAVLFQKPCIVRAHAWVQPNNLPSQRAFLRAGFSSMGIDMREGLTLHHYCINNNIMLIPK